MSNDVRTIGLTLTELATRVRASRFFGETKLISEDFDLEVLLQKMPSFAEHHFRQIGYTPPTWQAIDLPGRCLDTAWFENLQKDDIPLQHRGDGITTDPDFTIALARASGDFTNNEIH